MPPVSGGGSRGAALASTEWKLPLDRVVRGDLSPQRSFRVSIGVITSIGAADPLGARSAVLYLILGHYSVRAMR